MFATNCWVVAAEKGGECIIVDPGMPDITRPGYPASLAPEIESLISEHRLKPVAALLTHGHLDHTFSITPLADGYDIPTYIHSEDARFVAEPAGIHGEHFVEMISAFSFAAPKKLEAIRDGSSFEFLGMSIKTIYAPGHTRGSAMFLINDEHLLSGDVLFAGSIGRTDLPTGSMKDMQNTLRTKVLTLDDEIRVLPGHGDETTIKYERKTNPYLKELAL
jgi:glyoxylase-like metal-dependent hydrolase (beta-lactamase superfamily II)